MKIIAERTGVAMLAAALAAATEGAEKTHDLPAAPFVFGLAALTVFAVLLAVTYAFRSAGTKH